MARWENKTFLFCIRRLWYHIHEWTLAMLYCTDINSKLSLKMVPWNVFWAPGISYLWTGSLGVVKNYYIEDGTNLDKPQKYLLLVFLMRLHGYNQCLVCARLGCWTFRNFYCCEDDVVISSLRHDYWLSRMRFL